MRASGTFFAPRMCPALYSPGSRTSTTSASSRLMRCVACAGVTHGPPELRRNSGQSSMAPEMKATANRRRLLRTKSTRGDNYNRAMRKPVSSSSFCATASRDWNRENRFTGWTDVDLSRRASRRRAPAGRLLKADGYAFDLAYTSVLKRAIRTLWLALDELGPDVAAGEQGLAPERAPLRRLQGLNKAEMAAKFGEEQVLVWRRSYDTPPPPLAAGRPALRRRATRAMPGIKVPLTECLKDTVARVVPYWESDDRAGGARRQARADRRARQLAARAGEAPRRHLRRGDRRLNIPTGIPLVYELDEQLQAAEALLPRRPGGGGAARRLGRGARESEGLNGIRSSAARAGRRRRPGVRSHGRRSQSAARAHRRRHPRARKEGGRHPRGARCAARFRARDLEREPRARAPRQPKRARCAPRPVASAERRASLQAQISKREAAIERMLVAWSGGRRAGCVARHAVGRRPRRLRAQAALPRRDLARGGRAHRRAARGARAARAPGQAKPWSARRACAPSSRRAAPTVTKCLPSAASASAC